MNAVLKYIVAANNGRVWQSIWILRYLLKHELIVTN